MSKKLSVIVFLMVSFSMILAACSGPQAASPTGETPAQTEIAAPSGPPAECIDNPEQKKCAVFASGEVIKIGYAGPMTGDYAAFGIDSSQAGMLAIKDAGEFKGRPFELDAQDTQGSGEGGAAVANLFVSNPHIVAISGHTFSGSTAAAIPIYNQARIPMMSATSTRADLTEGDQDVFNRIPFTDDIQGSNVAEYLHDTLDLDSIALMHDGDTYGRGLAEKVRDVFIELGGEVVAFEPITSGEADYSSVLNAIAANQPQALFYGGYDAEAAVIKNQMELAGLNDVVFFTDDGVYGANFLKLTGDNSEGTYATASIPPASAAREKFDAAFKDAYGVEAGSYSAFTWHCYDTVAALISAIEKTAIEGADGNLYIPREALVKNVRGLSGYQALTGEITCNTNGECNTAGPTFFVVKDGKWVEAPKTSMTGN